MVRIKDRTSHISNHDNPTPRTVARRPAKRAVKWAHLQMMMCRSYACIVPSSGPGSIRPQSQPPQGCLVVVAVALGLAGMEAVVSGFPVASPWFLEVSGTLSLDPAAGSASRNLLLVLVLLVLLVLNALAARRAPAPRATQRDAPAIALCLELIERWPLISRALTAPGMDVARRASLVGWIWGVSRLQWVVSRL